MCGSERAAGPTATPQHLSLTAGKPPKPQLGATAVVVVAGSCCQQFAVTATEREGERERGKKLGSTATATVNRQQLPVTQMSARSQSGKRGGKLRKLPSSYVSIRLSLSVSVSFAVTSFVYQFLSVYVYTSLSMSQSQTVCQCVCVGCVG